MNDRDKLHRIICHLPLFAECSPQVLDAFVERAHLQNVQKGQVIFVHDDVAKQFYVVVSGWVKLFRETLDGAQAVVDILSDHHVFGETSIFQSDTYPYSAEAVEDGQIISMPLAVLKTEIDTNPKIAMAMLAAMARYRRQQDRELEHRVIQNAPQRIGCFLLRLTDQKSDGPVKIHLPYDKSLVASRLGMQPETFSRALVKLKDTVGMEINGSTIQMKNVQDLVKYSCSACSSEFPCKDLDGQTRKC